ncbi:MAG: hypothetical protein CK425_10705 [Parachlamydia sp.]|jgi:hypothetical protein|nr:MAG: hypothetical protein CK425_10705 [Parachlamydia sp.]
MNIVFTDLDRAWVYLAILFFTFAFSFFVWVKLFAELDYHEIKYTIKTKKRTLWVIYFNLVSLIIWWQVLQLLLSLLYH